MTLTLDNFVLALSSSGLLTAEEVEHALVRMSQADREDAQAVAQALVAQGKLTSYQARELLSGRTGGLVLGNYVVTDRLGAGGMGLVFKAQHRRMKREVALKTLPPQVIDSPEALKRFHREVEAAARLTHTNIVTAYDADEANGMHFLVMQFVPGSDLAHYVRRCGKLSVRKAVDCVLQAARGLHYAHQKGVVHRDIKPGNLLLDPDGVVRVLDMGLARLEQELGDNAEATFQTQDELTSTGRVIGTVDYMAPEQTVDAKHVDRRADIYSLGCTLHFLLAGRSPAPDGSLKVKLDWHESGPIPSLVEIRPDVPPELDIIFRRMMARNPDERYPSMGEVIPDLEACLAALADVPEATLELPQPAKVLGTGIAPATEAVVIPEMVSEYQPSDPPPPHAAPQPGSARFATPVPAPMPALAEPPRSGETSPSQDTQRSQLRPDATVVEKMVKRSTVGIKRAHRKERQAWLVAACVIGVGLLGGFGVWLARDSTPWNAEVKRLIEYDALLTQGVKDRNGRRLYSELMDALDAGSGGDWLIGAGLTRDETVKSLRCRQAGNQMTWQVRSLAADDSRIRDLARDEVRSLSVPPSDKSRPLATLERLELTLAPTAGGAPRLQGSVQCTRTSPDLVQDLTLELRRRAAPGSGFSTLESIPLDAEQIALGTIKIEALLPGATISAGDEIEVCLRGFLFQPDPRLYRLSNEATCRIAGGAPSNATGP